MISCGLAWPQEGYPAYYCICGSQIESGEGTFETPKTTVKLLSEGEGETMDAVLKALKPELTKKKCEYVHTVLQQERYSQFVRDFNRWKRDENVNARLKQTFSRSFEASVLKIKDLLNEKRLSIPLISLTRRQLSIFSKADLKNDSSFYAVRALAMVIDGYYERKQPKIDEKTPKVRAKYWW